MCVSCCSRILCLHLYLGETLQLVYRGAAWMSMSRGNARDVGRSQVELLCNNWKKLLRKMGCRVIHLARRHLWKSNPLVCWVGLGVDAGEGNGTPLQYSCLEKSHGRRSLVGYSPWRHKKSQTWLSDETFILEKSIYKCHSLHWRKSLNELMNYQ